MPPKARITRDMVAAAAFEAAREAGWEQINARTVSQRLNCSTQPVMYHFATIEELKKAAYRRTNEYHTEYLMNVPETREDVMLGIGLNYIRFAVEEPNLFRFLFQSGFAAENSVLEMLDSEETIMMVAHAGYFRDAGRAEYEHGTDQGGFYYAGAVCSWICQSPCQQFLDI